MALPEGTKDAIARGLMRFWSDKREEVAVVKAAIRAAVDDADAWVDANAASYNAALPVPFRTNATQPQKSILLVAVALGQYDPELLKRLMQAV